MFYIYILESQIKLWYYVGMAEDVVQKLAKHNSGSVRSTKAYRPFVLVYKENFDNKAACRKRGLAIKNNHALKQALIDKIK